jgi:hypothetical protein
VNKLSAGISSLAALVRLIYWDDITAGAAKFWREERRAAAIAHPRATHAVVRLTVPLALCCGAGPT